MFRRREGDLNRCCRNLREVNKVNSNAAALTWIWNTAQLVNVNEGMGTHEVIGTGVRFEVQRVYGT